MHLKLKYKYQLILYFFLVLSFMTLVFTIYTAQRNKDYSLKTLRDGLMTWNDTIYSPISNVQNLYKLDIAKIQVPENIRVTIMDTNHNVVYDNCGIINIIDDSDWEMPEFLKADVFGEATALRFSVPLKDEYLYYVKKYKNFYIRTGIKYETEDIPQINEDSKYLYFIIFLLGVLFAALIIIIKKLTRPLAAFNQFVDVLKGPDKDFSSVKFPHNEFGDLGQIIIDTFDQLEKTKRYKQQMSHNIAHELKTPVTGIMAYLETILTTENMTREQTVKFIEKAHIQTLRLSALINDVSVLNKIEEGASQFPIEEIYFSKCFNEVIEELGYKLNASNIKFEHFISSDLKINGCYQLVYSLFKNLIDNTIEHGGSNICITIRGGVSQRSGDHSYRVKFTYTDTGKGIPEQDLQRVFERFYRVDKGRTRKTGGSGLGLAIVKNAVLFHKGNITVENAPQGGAMFKFDLLSF